MQKTKIVIGIFKSYFRLAGLESMLLKCKGLTHFRGVQEGGEKKGDPTKMTSEARMLLKTKWREITICGFATILLKKQELSASCHDVDENKGTYWFWGLGAGD